VRAIEPDNLCVVLVSPRNPLNIGSAARAMSNFGFSCLRLVKPYELAFREARSAVDAGAVLSGAAEYDTLAEAVADCTLVVGTTAARRRELQHGLRPLNSGARLIRKHGGRVALLFGSEKRGLSNADLSHCHWLLHIPTHDEHVSMNLGQAVAVCLYELVRSSASRAASAKLSGVEASPSAAARGAQQERFTGLLLEALYASGYLKAQSSAATQDKLRRLVRRLNLRSDDAEVWLGMVRQIAWKLRADE
jgi:tRNA/rRNA methyltransferase